MSRKLDEEFDEHYRRHSVFDQMVFMVWLGIRFEGEALDLWKELCPEFSENPDQLIYLGETQDWSRTVFA